MKRTLFISMLILSLLVNGAGPVSAGKSDIATHWAKSAIETLRAHGIMNGYADGFFRPEDPISRAEFAALINRAFGFRKDLHKSFSDVKATDWFSKDVSIAATQGYLLGVDNEAVAPSANLSREQAATVLGRILKLNPVTGQPGFKDDSAVSTWAVGMTAAVVQEGYLKGSEGYFRPQDSITRGEVAAIIFRAVGQLYNKPQEYDGQDKTIDGNATISVSGVDLKNITINGNLYLTEGVEQGKVKLENVVVKGRVITAAQATKITLKGQFQEVAIKAAETSISLPNSSKVQKLVAEASADISGADIIQEAFINVNGITLDQYPLNLILADGVFVTINGKKVTKGYRQQPRLGGGSNSRGTETALTDLRKAEIDSSLLTIPNVELGHIVADLTLPLVGKEYSSTITWTSSQPAIIDNNGKVTRPPANSQDAQVVLQATITQGTAKVVKDFQLIVKKEELLEDNTSRELPSLAFDPDNNRYLLVYKKTDSERTPEQTGIYGSLVSANGEKLGEEFKIVGSSTITTLSLPSVTYSSKLKQFLLVWDDYRDNGTDGGANVYGQFVATDGSPVSQPFAVSDLTDGKEQTKPFLATDNNGNFLVIYNQQTDWHLKQADLHCRIVHADGTLGSNQVIVGGDWGQFGSSVIFDGTQFLVGYWDTTLKQLGVREVDTDGTLGSDTILASTDYKDVPMLAYDAQTGRTLVVWCTRYAEGSGAWVDDIYGRFIEADGTLSDTFMVADGTDTVQSEPSVASSAGEFSVVWRESDYSVRGATISAVDGSIKPVPIEDDATGDSAPVVCAGGSAALVTYDYQKDDQSKAVAIHTFSQGTSQLAFTAGPLVNDITTEQAKLTFTANADCIAYYLVVDKDRLTNPTKEEIVAACTSEAQDEEVLLRETWLVHGNNVSEFNLSFPDTIYANKEYDLFVVLLSEASDASEVKQVTFQTGTDSLPPVFIEYGNGTQVSLERSRALIITQAVQDRDEYYDLYLLVVEADAAPATTPTPETIAAQGVKYAAQHSGYTKGDVITYTGLTPETDYKVYFLAQDSSMAGPGGQGLYSEVKEVSASTTVDTLGPNLAGIRAEDCYTTDLATKQIRVQFDGDLYNNTADQNVFYEGIKGKIHIYDYSDNSDLTLVQRGDSVQIVDDSIVISFASFPTEGFQMYIEADTLAYADDLSSTNEYEIFLRVSLE